MSRIAGILRRPIVWLPISVGLLALIAWRSRLWEAGDRLTLLNPALIVVALLLNVPVALLWAGRSADLLAATGRPVPIGPLIPMTAFANTINNLTPGSAGEIVRVWMLHRHHEVSYRTGAAVVAIERLVAFAYLTGSAVVVWVGWVAGVPAPIVAALLALLAAAPGLVYLAGARPSVLVTGLPLGFLVGRDRWTRLTTWLRAVDVTVSEVVRHPARAAVFAVLTASLFACYTAQLVLVGGALGADIPAVPAWGALGLAMTAGIVSLLPFGLGTTDLALIALLGILGVDPVVATATTFGYRLVASLPLGITGVVAYAWLSARLPAGGTGAAIREVGRAMADEPDDERSA